jgi:hypothetical protein
VGLESWLFPSGLRMRTKSPGDFLKRDRVAPLRKTEFLCCLFQHHLYPK